LQHPLVLGFPLALNFPTLMELKGSYDMAIVGGGLAGLACAIQLGRQGFSVVLFEKEAYPFHKVCGEYISLESWEFLESLGVPLGEMGLPLIKKLVLTAPNGKDFHAALPLGGFGISRYKLDSLLAAIAIENGVCLLTETKVDDIQLAGDFTIRFQSKADGSSKVKAQACCGSWGKRGNMDVKWKRHFLQRQDRRLHNYIGVKYHVQADWPQDLIGLHNFKDGYCGISRIEEGLYCLCYLTTADQLKSCGNDIGALQERVLGRNPWLRKIFKESIILEGFPVTISQVSFHSKTQVEGGVLMLGDAAGMITPLCGNGMSIALHTAKIAAELLGQFAKGNISRSQMEHSYQAQWSAHFAQRLKTGRRLQMFFGSTALSNAFVGLFRAFPFLAKPVIKMTHGNPF
jgi:flavin-dependent dehydrogenase